MRKSFDRPYLTCLRGMTAQISGARPWVRGLQSSRLQAASSPAITRASSSPRRAVVKKCTSSREFLRYRAVGSWDLSACALRCRESEKTLLARYLRSPRTPRRQPGTLRVVARGAACGCLPGSEVGGTTLPPAMRIVTRAGAERRIRAHALTPY